MVAMAAEDPAEAIDGERLRPYLVTLLATVRQLRTAPPEPPAPDARSEASRMFARVERPPWWAHASLDPSLLKWIPASQQTELEAQRAQQSESRSM